MTRPLLLIFIDSLPYELVRRDGLFDWLVELRPMRPGVGYSFTQKAEVLQGLQPDSLGYLNYYRLTGARTVRLGRVHRLMSVLRDHAPLVDKLVHFAVAKLVPNVANIPFEMSGEFQRGVPQTFGKYPTSVLSVGAWEEVIGDADALPDEETIRRAREKIRGGGGSLLVALWELDSIGHAKGPNSDEYRAHARLLDDRCRQLAAAFMGAHPDGHVALFSDHGMLDVQSGLRVPAHMFDLESGRRACYWLDSTMLRVWTDSPEETETIRARLGRVSGLRLLSERERLDYGVSSPDFGNLIGLTQPGFVFVPNHFGVSRPRGMHGYHPDSSAHLATFASSAPAGDATLFSTKHAHTRLMSLLSGSAAETAPSIAADSK